MDLAHAKDRVETGAVRDPIVPKFLEWPLVLPNDSVETLFQMRFFSEPNLRRAS